MNKIEIGETQKISEIPAEELRNTELGLAKNIEWSLGLHGLLPVNEFCSYSEIGRLIPHMAKIDASSIVSRMAKLQGDGLGNIGRRITSLERLNGFIDEQFYFYYHDSKISDQEETLVNTKVEKSLTFGNVENTSNFLKRFVEDFKIEQLKFALSKDPELEGKIVRIYSLMDTLNCVASGLEGIMQMTTPGLKEMEKREERLDMYIKYGKNIPRRLTKVVGKDQVKIVYDYSEPKETDLECGILFGWAMQHSRWDDAKRIAQKAIKVRDVDKFVMNGHMTSNPDRWTWIVDNFELHKNDFIYIKTGNRPSVEK